MAKPSVHLINALRAAAGKMESSVAYQWGHMGAFNCGFLAQEITSLTPAEIHRRALMGHGDWTEQLNDYCAVSGLPLDDVIAELIGAGFSTVDLKNLERLCDPEVLRELPVGERLLRHNSKIDAIRYLNTWATLLETHMLENISLENLSLIVEHQ